MLLSTPHLFSTSNDKFHFQSSAIFSRWWYLHTLCFGVSQEKSKWDWHFWLNFTIIWANAVCAPKWWWVLAPRPCWAQKYGLWEMLAVTHVGCPGEMGHNQLLLCTADSSSFSWSPPWWDSDSKYWGVRVGRSFPWACITWPQCPFCHWSFWWQDRRNEEL